MKRLALATTAVVALAAPVFADAHSSSFAVMHFNMSTESASDIVMVPSGDIMMADLTMGSTLAEVFRILNMSVENMSDLVGEGDTVTIIMSNPTHAQDIFDMLMEADDSN